MIESTELTRIKQQVTIYDLLASRGFYPVSQSGGELAYRSPLRDDKHPSFYVNSKQNVFNDKVVYEHRGDVIRLMQLLDKINFSTAVQTLQQFEGLTDQPFFSLSGYSSIIPASKGHIREVKLLQNPTLVRYVESRGISFPIARAYLREIHYMHNERHLYAVGFANDLQGYALRNGVGCKRNIGPSTITTIPGMQPESLTANIFEGFFDFLSALMHFSQSIPTFPTYVLNSVSHLQSLLPRLSNYSRINVYFDRDKAGFDALQTLQIHNLPIIDRSCFYIQCKDFNEYFLSLKVNPMSTSKKL